MSQQDHFKKLENMYLQANVNTHIFDTTQCHIQLKKATIQLDITPKYFHALGAMHGSVYFKLLDDAAFFAVNSIVEDVFVLTTSFNINLLRPVSEGRIRSEGRVKFASSTLFIAESTLFDQHNKEVAFGTGHFAKSKIQLQSINSYTL